MNSTIRAYVIILVCLLLITGLPLTYSSSASSSSTLVIYAPPSIIADNHLYPFFIQAVDSSGNPLSVSATLYVSTSSFYDTVNQPQAQLIDGQTVVFMNATSPGNVILSASAQGFQGASLTVNVGAVGSPPFSINLAAPSTGVNGEQVPVIVGAYYDNAPFPDALSSPLYLTSPGKAIDFSFDGQPYSIQYPTAGGGNITVAGNFFNSASITVPALNSSASTGQLKAAYLPVVDSGRWPVVLYAVNGSEPVSTSNIAVYGTSNNPAIASVQPTTTVMNGLYSIVYVNVIGEGNATLTFQSQGFNSTRVALDSVAPPGEPPLMMKAFGPSAGAFANPVKMIQLMSYSGIPIHAAFAQQIVLTSSALSEVLHFNSEGIADLNLSSPAAPSTQFLAQMQDSAPTTFTASLFFQPFTATLESNAPVNFMITSAKVTAPYNTTMTVGLNSIPNATIMFSNGEQFSVKNLSLANGMIEVTAPSVFTPAIPDAMYVFTGWSDGVVNASRYVASGSDITAEYTPEFLVSVQTSYGQVVGGPGYYHTGSTATLKLSSVSIPTGFLTYRVFVGWQNQATGQISRGTNTFTVNGPMSFQAAWTVDYSKLLILLAAVMAVVVGAVVFLMWRRSRRAS